MKRPVAFITGASRGIGRAIAIELARHGHDIAGSARGFDPADTSRGLLEVKQRVEELGGRFLPLQGDVAALDDHDRMIDEIHAEYGRLDVLVNNAGVAPEQRLDVLEMHAASYDRVLGINLRGPFFLSQNIARRMLRQTGENPAATRAIVFITSVSAYTSSLSRAEYCISKVGLSMAAAVFADRLSAHGIQVYEVRPGIIRTDMTSAVKEKYDKRIAEGLIPQMRWGTPEDVGKTVAALVGGSFNYSTGAVIEVSGGMNVRRL
ncbi:MAG: 3-ketoacyl-ACP reductase [Verrucomicrobia bacterium]|nr:3-ketoacyl-ACP reductase [Verrucomicrobiota bacterium]